MAAKHAPIVRYRGMARVESEYAASGLSDTEFAKAMSTPDVTYTLAQVREWRRMLNIPNNKTPVNDSLVELLVETHRSLGEALGCADENHCRAALTELYNKLKVKVFGSNF